MKRLFILFLILLFVIPLALARQTEYSQDDNLRIDLVNYSPSPVLLGSKSTLNFEVTNVGTETLKNLKFTAAPKFPIFLISSSTITIDELKPDESKQFKFEVRVSSSGSEGNHTFGVQFDEPTLDQTTATAYKIYVKRMQRAVASTTITTTPEMIPPGGKAFIDVEIENNAGFAMRDVSVRLNFTDSVPLAPYKTTAEKQINVISSGLSEKVTFQVIALPDAEPDVYRLRLEITFDDELGNKNTRNDFIGIIISSKPDYDIVVEDSTLIKRIKDKVTISISNIGPSNIKYLVLEILPSKDYEILNPPRTYLGNLEPDDYETAEFDIYPKKSGHVNIKVKLEYKDDLNNPVIETKEVKTYVYSKLRAKMLGLMPTKLTSNSVLAVLFVIFAYLTYRSWRSTKNIVLAMKQALLKMFAFVINIIRNLRWKRIKRIPRKIRIFFIKLR